MSEVPQSRTTDQRELNGSAVGVSGGAGVFLPADSDVVPEISFVMPTMNEEEGIAECIDQIQNAVEALDMPAELIVSDSSDDMTPEIARSMGAIVVEPDQPGYGYAYQYAFERCRGKYIAIGDADTTYDFEEVPDLYEMVASGDADMAMGSRLDGEIRPGSMPTLHKYVGNPILTRFLNAFYDAGVSDAHSGMRVFTREAWEKMDCETTGMEFASEMIMEAGAKDLTIAEKPIVYHERVGEETLDSLSDGWRHVKFMLVNAPEYLFSIPGFVLALSGLLLMGVVALGVPLGGVTLGTHSMIVGSLLMILGTQVLSLGVFSAITSDPIREPTDPFTQWIKANATLEWGATVGLALFTVGAVYATWLTVSWITNGYDPIPLTVSGMVAFTAIVIGAQTVFSSFFFSSIR